MHEVLRVERGRDVMRMSLSDFQMSDDGTVHNIEQSERR